MDGKIYFLCFRKKKSLIRISLNVENLDSYCPPIPSGRAKCRRNNDRRNNGDGDTKGIAIAIIGKAVIPTVLRPT